VKKQFIFALVETFLEKILAFEKEFLRKLLHILGNSFIMITPKWSEVGQNGGKIDPKVPEVGNNSLNI